MPPLHSIIIGIKKGRGHGASSYSYIKTNQIVNDTQFLKNCHMDPLNVQPKVLKFLKQLYCVFVFYIVMHSVYPKINASLWLCYMKKMTIIMSNKGTEGRQTLESEKAHLTGEFIIVKSLVTLCCVIQPLAFQI